jgi:hypothetical protein
MGGGCTEKHFSKSREESFVVLSISLAKIPRKTRPFSMKILRKYFFFNLGVAGKQILQRGCQIPQWTQLVLINGVNSQKLGGKGGIRNDG